MQRAPQRRVHGAGRAHGAAAGAELPAGHARQPGQLHDPRGEQRHPHRRVCRGDRLGVREAGRCPDQGPVRERGAGRADRAHLAARVVLPRPEQPPPHAGRLDGAGALADQAEPGLRLPHDVLAAQGHVLRPAGGRHPGQEELYLDHEKLRPRENGAARTVVCARVLPTRLHREDVQVCGTPLAGSVLPDVLQ